MRGLATLCVLKRSYNNLAHMFVVKNAKKCHKWHSQLQTPKLLRHSLPYRSRQICRMYVSGKSLSGGIFEETAHLLVLTVTNVVSLMSLPLLETAVLASKQKALPFFLTGALGGRGKPPHLAHADLGRPRTKAPWCARTTFLAALMSRTACTNPSFEFGSKVREGRLSTGVVVLKKSTRSQLTTEPYGASRFDHCASSART